MTLAADVATRLQDLTGPYLARQRWFARQRSGPPDVEVLDAKVLIDGHPSLVWMLVRAGGSDYQLLIGLSPPGDAIDFLSGHDEAVLGRLNPEGTVAGGEDHGRRDDWTAYDAVLDGRLSARLLQVMTEDRIRPDRARLISAEQSNTSIVYDERFIAKVFRRLRPGSNPDVEVSFALDRVGFNHIATPIAVWQQAGYDLAFVQQFLAGGTEGWALALTSLRDLYAGYMQNAGSTGEAPSPEAGPEEFGGDFAAEAHRLGHVTARLHLAMAEAFGRHAGQPDEWAASIAAETASLAEEGLDHHAAGRLLDRLRKAKDAGAQIRVHGDYHLGQVMRTDAGWFVLDFEGEPARPVAERAAPRSPLKDVAGMLRSFQYAAAVALNERGESERIEALYKLGGAWEQHNREAFLAGYRATRGIAELVPSDDASFLAVLAAFELEKATYELGYERAYRPDWVLIPRAALERLLGEDTNSPGSG